MEEDETAAKAEEFKQAVAKSAFQDVIVKILPLLDADDEDFEATAPDFWSPLRRATLKAIAARDVEPKSIEAFWTFLARFVPLSCARRFRTQMLEVVSAAAAS